MKSKRGFTLIELLAVLVVLAVVALIATPMVTKTIENSKKGTAIESANNLIQSVEYYFVSANPKYGRIDVLNDKLNYKGKKPELGEVEINEKGDSRIYAYINGYCVTKEYDGEAYASKINKENCNWFGTDNYETKEGTIFTLNNQTVSNYLIYGNSVQDGTPTPSNPIEISSTGDLITKDNCTSYGSDACNNIGKYVIPVKVSGKNLLPYSYKGHSVTDAGVKLSAENDALTINGTATSLALLSFVKKNNGIVEDITLSAGTYTISVQGTGTITDNGNFLQVWKVDGDSLTNAGQIGLNKNVTFTLEKTQAIRLRVVVYSGRSYNATFNIQLEHGTTATEYEPYVEPKTTNIYLDEPLRKVGEYADYIDFNNKKVVRNVGKFVFNGKEAWVKQNNGAYILNQLQYRPLSAMCDKFIFEESTKSWTENGKFGWNTGGIIWFMTDDFSSVSKNNITVYYQLQNPTEKSITLPSIQTLDGVSTLSINTGVQPSNVKLTIKK